MQCQEEISFIDIKTRNRKMPSKSNDDSSRELFHRRRRARQQTSSNRALPKNATMIMSQCLFRILIAILYIRTEAFHFQSSTARRSKPMTTSNIDSTIRLQFQNESPISQVLTTWRTLDSTLFAEPPTKSKQEEAIIETSLPSSELGADEGLLGDHEDHTTSGEAAHETIPFFASQITNATTDETIIPESERFGVVSRRDAFRYSAVLASALFVTGMTFTQTDPSRKSPVIKTSLPAVPTPKLEPVNLTKVASQFNLTDPSQKAPLPSTTTQPPVSTSKLEPVNLTKVAAQTNINVTMNCPQMCVSIDSSNFTFTKVEKAKSPDWLPAFLKPKAQVIKKIPNSELLVAATVAGSAMEMVRTSLLYPLQTVKVRIQADQYENIGSRSVKPPSLSEQITTLSSNIRQKIDEGNLYAGISPTLLVSVPATGIYYGIRDVTKQLLFMTPLDSTWIAVGGAFVGDVVSLGFRVPADALAIRLQAQQNTTTAGDWLGDSFRRLPMVILTDLPYLLSKIVLNKAFIQGDLAVSEYAFYAALASVIAGFLTTPFDVARTRILLDKWSVEEREEIFDIHDENGEFHFGNSTTESIAQNSTQFEDVTTTSTTSNPGNSVIQAMIQITKEGDGGIVNLFSGWLERVVYLGIGRAWLEPIQLIGYIGIRDAVLLEWF